ncbi:WRKY Transcription Factor [Orobanche minor]
MAGGSDDQVAIMGHVPTTFFSSTIGDDNKAGPLIVGFDSGNRSGLGLPFPGSGEYSAHGNVDRNGPARCLAVGIHEAISPAEPKLSSRGGLVERMAARAGYNVPRLNTESIIRPPDLYAKRDVGSPYLTIPPGLSPTALLESPVFLSNSLVQPSPTTGKIPSVPSGNNRDSTLMTDDRNYEDAKASSFVFRPAAESAPLANYSAVKGSFPSVEVSAHSERKSANPPEFQLNNNNVLFEQADISKSHAEDNGGFNLLPDQTYYSVGLAENSPPLDEQQNEDEDQISSDQDPSAGGDGAEDGYNWRKYGQKHVKGSKYPRSYYKCTHQSCPVKKKVERSREGHITEIIYKGAHNHPKPPPNRRSALGSSNAQPGGGETNDLIWSVQRGNLEPTLLFPRGHECSNGAANTLPAQSGDWYEFGDGIEESSTFSNNKDDDRAAYGSLSVGNDGEGEESESKRRRIETYASEMTGTTRGMREPRVVVQTTSDVDILDDGYRWRKYGQKVVKGNPNPRSYYKCTSTGCNVRKHVERASHDLKAVITTYEGKHNHDVPAARNSGNVNSGGPNTLPSQQALVTRREPCGRTSWFERPQLAMFGPPGRPQAGHEFGFGMNQQGPASLGLAGSGPHQGKLPTFTGGAYAGNQPRPLSEMAYMLSKEELRMEPMAGSGLNSAVGTSVYQPLVSRMPLGPQM